MGGLKGPGTALLAAGIVPNKTYYGIVEFYDPDFDSAEGRGRIRGYIGQFINGSKTFKLFEVFESGIEKALELNPTCNRKILHENEIVRFRISIGKFGFTAVDVISVMRVDPKVAGIDDLIIKLYSNSSCESGHCPIGPSLPLLGPVKEEPLPTIIRLSKEKINEQT